MGDARARHAIISGGSSGIGLALATLLAQKGWSISILARRRDLLNAARRQIAEASGRSDAPVLASSVDVRDEPALQKFVGAAAAEFGVPSLVVASAGIVIPGTFSELPPEAFATTMDVNYFGSVHLVRTVLPLLRAQHSGHIVLISSGAGLLGIYGYTAYAPTKFAVRGFAEALRGELVPDGVTVHIVYPPDTDTPQLREEMQIRPAATSKISGHARICSPEYVAASIIRGVERGHFVIAPGLQMRALSRLHSLIGPLLNRFSFDPIVASLHDKEQGN